MSPVVILSVLTAFMGCSIIGLALFGWCGRELKMAERIILIPCSVFLMMDKPLWLNGVGFVMAALVLGKAVLDWKKSKEVKAV